MSRRELLAPPCGDCRENPGQKAAFPLTPHPAQGDSEVPQVLRRQGLLREEALPQVRLGEHHKEGLHREDLLQAHHQEGLRGRGGES